MAKTVRCKIPRITSIITNRQPVNNPKFLIITAVTLNINPFPAIPFNNNKHSPANPRPDKLQSPRVRRVTNH